MEYDVTLGLWTGKGQRRTLRLGLPAAISAPMIERGYNRARVSIVPDGILLRPYKAGSGWGSNGEQVEELPDW